MKIIKASIRIFCLSILVLFCMNCEFKDSEQVVLIETTLGNIKVKLYNETPQHRDNFIKLVKSGYYDGTLFHRVINEFMIQGGDGDSKNAPAGKMLGTGDPGYTIPAEFVYPRYFHRRGALAAARQGDNVNPQKRSSGSQFYIVTGKSFSDEQLTQFESQMKMRREQSVFQSLVAERQEEIMNLRRARDREGLQILQDTLIAITKERVKNEGPFHFTPEQRKAYTSVGGAPHLDGDYTVFGEVIEGLNVVAKIEQVETGAADRPVEDVKVIKMQLVK